MSVKSLAEIGIDNLREMMKNPKGKSISYTPLELIEKFAEFVQWSKDNPYEKKELARAGQSVGDELTLKVDRAYTLQDWYTFAGITKQTWCNYRNKNTEISRKSTEEDRLIAQAYLDVTTRIDDMILGQKMQGAMHGTYNPNLVAYEIAKQDSPENQDKGSMKLTDFFTSDKG